MTERQASAFLRLVALNARISAGDALPARVAAVLVELGGDQRKMEAFVEAALVLAEQPRAPGAGA